MIRVLASCDSMSSLFSYFVPLELFSALGDHRNRNVRYAVVSLLRLAGCPSNADDTGVSLVTSP